MSSAPLEPLDLVLLARPSCRTIAYCGVLQKLGMYPREVIWLPGGMPFYEDLLAEDGAYGYSHRYFDISLNPLKWLKESGAIIHNATNDDINSPEVFGLICSCSASNLLFSAAGIVAPATLATGKRFIHIHPGRLPDYRGSTCFYYSLLEEGEVAATAFIMNQEIDDGLLLGRSRFTLNIRVEKDQRLFMDHILDPYIRAQVLKHVLVQMRAGAMPQTGTNRMGDRPICYVMHPLLRALAVARLHKDFKPGMPIGIFEHKID